MNATRILLLGAAALAATPAIARTPLLQLHGSPVVDAAGIIPPAEEEELVRQLTRINAVAGHQVAVATLATLDGDDVVDYGNRLFRQWALGGKQTNDGVLLLIAVKERKSRVEVGYGLTPVLTDSVSGRINTTYITPKFKQGDYPGGISAGVEAIGAVINAPQAAPAAAAPAQATEGSGGAVWGWLAGLLGLGAAGGGLLVWVRRRQRRQADAEQAARRRAEDLQRALTAQRSRSAEKVSGQEELSRQAERDRAAARLRKPAPVPSGAVQDTAADAARRRAENAANAAAASSLQQARDAERRRKVREEEEEESRRRRKDRDIYTTPIATPNWSSSDSNSSSSSSSDSSSSSSGFDGGGGSSGGGGDTGSW